MNFERKIILGFALAVVILILLGGYSFKNNQESILTNKMVTHTNEVLYNMEQMLVATLDIVVGQRGYELSGNEEFLEPYTRGSRSVFDRLAKIRILVADNEHQMKRLDTLERLVSERVQFSKQRIEAKRKVVLSQHDLNGQAVSDPKFTNTQSNPVLAIERGDANGIMNQIRSLTYRIQSEEKTLLVARIEANKQQITEFNLTFTALLTFMAILLIAVFFIIRTNQRARIRSDEKALSYQNLMETSIESQKEVLILSIDRQYRYLLFNSSHKESTLRAYGIELAIGMNLLDTMTDPADRAKAKANFDRALSGESHMTVEEYGNVERFYFETHYNPIFDSEHHITGATAFSSNITERKRAEEHLLKITQELSVANKELDAFCYSVSHDLRAPLRSINGYAKILLEDYSAKLDQEGRTVLGTVVNNARKMGQLIDDLLAFSRIAKIGISKTKLSMDRLVHETVDEQFNNEGSRVDMEIHPLQPTSGDSNMIKQVWTNLISNAVKYSSKVAMPKIEIGSSTENGDNIYYVKDNGVGFDMIYASKLFGVFQRLHKSVDFEGTGVGLAIVSRIIQRHGGKVWAESKPDEGAIFYFSLPN